jgi:hypothetical protein
MPIHPSRYTNTLVVKYTDYINDQVRRLSQSEHIANQSLPVLLAHLSLAAHISHDEWVRICKRVIQTCA